MYPGPPLNVLLLLLLLVLVCSGPGGKHNTVINVPGWDKKEMPSKDSKLTIDVSTRVCSSYDGALHLP